MKLKLDGLAHGEGRVSNNAAIANGGSIADWLNGETKSDPAPGQLRIIVECVGLIHLT
jgi:hypothetical protein